jgi:hypothetical protein
MSRPERALWLLALLFLAMWALLVDRHRHGKYLIDAGAAARSPMVAAAAEALGLPAAPRPLRVLFIGNSLTSSNGIPSMIAQLALAAGQARRFEFTQDTPGGIGLSEHLAAGRLPVHLARGPWDFVVLQDQGQRPSWGKAQREEWLDAPARGLVAAITAAHVAPVFYATYARRDGDRENFPYDSYDAMQARISEGYAEIASELHAGLVPVGAIWQTAHHAQPGLPLWVADGLHPTPAGSYLAACAFYTYFYEQSAEGNPYVAGLPVEQARFLQAIAARVMSGAAPAAASADRPDPRVPARTP